VKLRRSFFARSVHDVAPELVGATLLVDGVGGKIVEVEAYDHEDPAAHSFHGPTARNASMFGPPGHAYVYFVYGMHWCMNVVTQAEGTASAVLLRGLEPVKNVVGRTQGPALLCRAMGIDGRLNGRDLVGDTFFLAAPSGEEELRIVRRPRIGVDYAGRHWARRLLRFYVHGNPFVSRL